MAVHIIAMLTNHDKTVHNALRIFDANKCTRVNCWGFKDIGISIDEATELVSSMKAAGKTTFLEPLVVGDEKCIGAAQFAINCKFDYLIGMEYNEKAAYLLKENGVKFFPTCGRRAGLPRMLYGSPEEIIDCAGKILAKGVDGICLSVYRYADGDPEELAKRFVEQLDKPFMIAGGINCIHRLNIVKELQPWGFTIGSALFNDSFGGNTSIWEKLDGIKDYMVN